jgi:putative addiction module killer protein
VIQLIEAVDERGVAPYAVWRESLDRSARVRVVLAVFRLGSGNFSAAKGIGGIFELRLDFGPGYRVYFGRDGEEIILLLGGGTKKRQQDDIEDAKRLWNEYKAAKRTKSKKGAS